MRLALSTNWNSFRHDTGEAMLDEIGGLGFDRVELGYALTFGQAEGVRNRLREGRIRVVSVHAFCPFPFPGASAGPEPFSICDPKDFKGRKEGVKRVLESGRFAAENGASALVLHAGRVPVFRDARRLGRMVQDGLRRTPKYEKRLLKFQMKRERKAVRFLDTLRASLDELLPEFDGLGVNLCLENLPTGDACPNEPEMHALLREFEGSRLRYWHDCGHAQIRHEEGLIHHGAVLKRFAPFVGGMHLHDVFPPIEDHGMPPGGLVKFELFKPFLDSDVPLVLEPARGLETEKIAGALDYLAKLWDIPTATPDHHTTRP